jgi:hypothetical protein
MEGGERAYGPLLQKLSYSGGQFARVGADILLDIDSNMRIKNSGLLQRASTSNEMFEPLSPTDDDVDLYNIYDAQLIEPQPLRFFVRQNPKPSSEEMNEAVGFYIYSEKSLPPGTYVDDWSSAWPLQ